MAAWKLHVTLSEVCDDATLLQDLRSVSDQTKMFAIAIVSMLAENEAVQAMKVVSKSLFDESRPVPVWMERKVCREAVQALEAILDAEEVHVRVPAAITMYSMDKQTDEVSRQRHELVELGQCEIICVKSCEVSGDFKILLGYKVD